MRGTAARQATMLTAVTSDALVPLGHPIRQIKLMVKAAWRSSPRSSTRCMPRMDITPHIARKQHSAINARTTRHEGYCISQRIRKRVEAIFGWVKTVAGERKLRYCGVEKNQLWAEVTVARYNLVRLPKLTQAPV